MKFKQWLILTEVKKASDIAKELLGNDINQIKSIIPTDIPEKLQSQLLPIAAYYYKQQPNINTLKQDLQDYAELVKLNKMQIITVNDDLTINNEFKNYLHWTQVIHGKQAEDRIINAPVPQGNLEDQELIEKSTDGRIKVYKANSVNQCIILGRGETFCISQPANTMFQSYRDSKVSTFYFVHDNTRTDDLAIVVVDATEHGIELTDRKNQTASTMQNPYSNTPKRIQSDPQLYFKYLKQNGINTDIFVNIPKSEEEEAEHEKLGESDYSLDWFKSLTPEEKSKYIGRGHELSNQQFDYLYDNKFMLLLTQYVRIGRQLLDYQLEKIAKVRDLKDKYLHNRLIADQNLKDLSKKEYNLMSPKQKEEFFNVDADEKYEKSMRIGELEKLKEAIKDGAKISDHAVRIAAKNGRLDIVKYIVEKGEKISDSNAVEIAAESGNLNLVKYLVDEISAKISDYSVENAASNGHFDIVKYLVEKGAKISDRSVENAARYGHFDIVKYLVEKGAKISDSAIAVSIGHLDIVKYLVEKGAKISDYSVEIAAFDGRLDIVKYLVEKGAKISDSAISAKKGHLDIVKYLVEKGAKISDRTVNRSETQEIKNYLIQKQKEQQ